MRFESEGSFPTNPGRPLPEAGLELGHLKLVSRIGKGGMGDVWKAFDPSRNAHVALKFLPPEIQDHPRELRRVKDSFLAVWALQHPHICPVYFLEDFPGFGHVLGMKFIDGVTLLEYRDHYVDQNGEFSLAEVVRLLTPVAQALDYAHDPSAVHPDVAETVVHRDIKPENILISPDGKGIQIVDFGLVVQVRLSLNRLSRSDHDTVGTGPYMPPEQWRGRVDDGRTDQYALAVVAYELIGNHLPFEFHSVGQLRECVLNDPVPLLDGVPDHVNKALLRGLSKSPQDRFPTCADLISAFDQPEGTSQPNLQSARTIPGGQQVTPHLRKSAFSQSAGQLNDSLNGQKSKQEALLRVDGEKKQQIQLRKLTERVPKIESWRINDVYHSMLFSPFSQDEARRKQEDWAAYAGRPVSWENSVGMLFRLIPPGAFVMGSADSDSALTNDACPAHWVRITKPFYCGVYLVTQAEYTAVVGRNPSHFSHVPNENTDRFPVDSVSWDDAQRFIDELMSAPWERGRRYRLLTEAEWEYACRAGSESHFSPGSLSDTAQFRFRENSPPSEPELWALRSPCTVGAYPPNAFDLYDQHGNVWEWCSDWYGATYYEESSHADPQGPVGGKHRVCRGGSAANSPEYCTSWFRDRESPDAANAFLSFRIACEV